jgi:hypothetical protein
MNRSGEHTRTAGVRKLGKDERARLTTLVDRRTIEPIIFRSPEVVNIVKLCPPHQRGLFLNHSLAAGLAGSSGKLQGERACRRMQDAATHLRRLPVTRSPRPPAQAACVECRP